MEDQAAQAQAVVNIWNSLRPKDILGVTFMSWQDEWWKAGGILSHDPGGWYTNNCPDGYASEEWWGIVDINRIPRQAYQLFKEFFGGLTPTPPPAGAEED